MVSLWILPVKSCVHKASKSTSIVEGFAVLNDLLSSAFVSRSAALSMITMTRFHSPLFDNEKLQGLLVMGKGCFKCPCVACLDRSLSHSHKDHTTTC